MKREMLHILTSSLRDALPFDKPLLQYDVPALKALALDRIRSELAKCDIVEEAFSRFASRRVG